MVHRMLGRAHAELSWRLAHGRERGQGTVEYVGLMLLVAGLLAAIVAVAQSVKGGDGIATAIVNKLKATIDGMGSSGGAAQGK